MLVAIVALAHPIAAAHAAHAAHGERVTIDLRDAFGRREVESISEDADGMKVRWSGEKAVIEQSLRWDQIRAVEGGSAPAQRAEWLALGEQLWRARTRLAREIWWERDGRSRMLREHWRFKRMRRRVCSG